MFSHQEDPNLVFDLQATCVLTGYMRGIRLEVGVTKRNW